MKFCGECQAVFDEFGFTDCKREDGDKCERDRALFTKEVTKTKGEFTLPVIKAIGDAQMPEDFEPSMPMFCAMAQLLYEALVQNEALLRQVTNREQRRRIEH